MWILPLINVQVPIFLINVGLSTLLTLIILNTLSQVWFHPHCSPSSENSLHLYRRWHFSTGHLLVGISIQVTWFLHSNQRLMISLLESFEEGHFYFVNILYENTPLWKIYHILTKTLKVICVWILSHINV